MASLIGQSLGRYHIVEQLGEGGMATVYKAFDTRLERDVAIKFIRRGAFPAEMLDHILKRFDREAKSLARLSHPNIVGVIDYGEYEGSPYLVMEYLPGGTLKERLGKPMPWQEAVRLLLPIIYALDFAHDHKIVHRDIKPSNILLTEKGRQPMLSDFGIAKILEEGEATVLTGTGVGVGTPEYMAPEQWTGQVGPLSDLYSVGVVLFELVTGRKPYTADTPAAILLKQAIEPLPRPSQFVPDLPEALDKVLYKALAKQPEERYPCMSDFAAALDILLISHQAQVAWSDLPTQSVPGSQEPLPGALETATPAPGPARVETPPPPARIEPIVETPPPPPVEPASGGPGQPLGPAAMETLIARTPPPPVAGQPVVPTPIPLPAESKAPRASRRWLGWVIGAAALVILVAVGLLVLRPGRATPTAKSNVNEIPTLVPTNPEPVPTLVPTKAPVVPLLLPTSTVDLPAEQRPLSGPVPIRWAVGLGTGSEPAQVPVEKNVVDDFNNSQNKIKLTLEVVPNASARATLANQIAAGSAPDIVGPVGWIGSNAFTGQWLDMTPFMQYTRYDTSRFEPAMLRQYQTEYGQVGLPFAVYPSAIYYNIDLFMKAGLKYPPSAYGDQYKMPDGSSLPWDWNTLAQVARLLTLDSTGKHSGQAGFNRNAIVQYGFSFGWEGNPSYWGTFMSNGGRMFGNENASANFYARIPDGWKAAWQWVYDGIWGPAPFIPSSPVASSSAYLSGNVFGSGKVAMIDSPSWYLCCIYDLVKAGQQFDFAAMPIGLDGQVAGRVDADTFRIWKGTKFPLEAFQVVAYLVDTGINKLVVGSSGQAPAYGALPGQTSLRQPWLANQKSQFPFVQHWETLVLGLNYPDNPSAEAYMPHINESWTRIQSFGDLLTNNPGLNLPAQEAALESDLKVIFNR